MKANRFHIIPQKYQTLAICRKNNNSKDLYSEIAVNFFLLEERVFYARTIYGY